MVLQEHFWRRKVRDPTSSHFVDIFSRLLSHVEMACSIVHVVLKKVAVVVRRTSKGESNNSKKTE